MVALPGVPQSLPLGQLGQSILHQPWRRGFLEVAGSWRWQSSGWGRCEEKEAAENLPGWNSWTQRSQYGYNWEDTCSEKCLQNCKHLDYCTTNHCHGHVISSSGFRLSIIEHNDQTATHLWFEGRHSVKVIVWSQQTTWCLLHGCLMCV